MIVVVAALIEKDECVLIARRSTGDDNLKGKWEFPGGKVNKDETKQSALKREIY
ncbi:MAG TPA: NUDIX domain-containing protein, partial [Gallicola sp.]|nr:NUDIX domain-containing protein [Gallicola sp.]